MLDMPRPAPSPKATRRAGLKRFKRSTDTPTAMIATTTSALIALVRSSSMAVLWHAVSQGRVPATSWPAGSLFVLGGPL